MRKWVKKHKKRIIVFILSLVFGVGSAFALSCPAFAYSDISTISIDDSYVEYNTYSWSRSDFIATEYAEHYNSTAGTYSTYPTQGYYDYYFHIKDTVYFGQNSYYFPNYNITGYFVQSDQFNIDFVPSSFAGENFSIDNVLLVDTTCSTDGVYIQENASTMSVVTSTANNHTGRSVILKRKIYYYLDGYLRESYGLQYETIYHFRVFGTNYLVNYLNNSTATNTIVNRSLYGTPNTYFKAIRTDYYYLYNILLQQSANTTSIINSIDSAKNQAHTDNVAINNNLQGDDQILSDISDGQNLADSRIGAVDSIIASVAPDADTSIQNVSTVITNNGTFWSSQRNASLFWKEIISDIYDSTITGFLGIGLSIILIIILFIFILRL